MKRRHLARRLKSDADGFGTIYGNQRTPVSGANVFTQ